MTINNFRIIPDINNLDEYIKLAKEKNLAFEYNDFFIPDILDDSEKCDQLIRAYREAFDRLDYHRQDHTMHGAFLDVTIFSNDSLIRKVSEQRMLQSMEIASKLNAKGVVFHTNYIAGFKDDNYYQTFISYNERFMKDLLAKYPNIEIYMENMFDIEPYLICRMGDTMKSFKNFGLCLDYAHVNVFGRGANKEDWLESCRPYIKHIHINDNDLVKDSHWALGDGLIDYKYFFEYYRKNLMNIPVLIEVNGLDRINKSLDYLAGI